MVWGVGPRVPHRLSHLVGASSPHAHVRLGVRLQCHQPYHSHPGHISSPKPPSIAHPSSIAVGNGFVLPITSVGDSVLPESFYLNDVLVAPNLIESLLSVCHFTTNNSCSMEFDPFDLSIKDLATKCVLARYDSTSPLYTLPLPTSTTPTLCAVLYTLATAASSATWHRRHGHLSFDVLSKLSSSPTITCPR
jgi:hypothetical protein